MLSFVTFKQMVYIVTIDGMWIREWIYWPLTYTTGNNA
jgi:hypothetical protein